MNGDARVFLGIDVGSSGAKATAVDVRGNRLAQASSEIPTSFPRPGWAEQDPEDWYEAACQVIRTCLERGRFAANDIACIAVVGPAHNVALLGDGDTILRPTIHWSDVRSVRESEILEDRSGDRIFTLSGQPVNPSWTMSQLFWLKSNEPETWKNLRKVLVTKDYVRHRLTGDYLTDPFDAVGTQFYGLEEATWSSELCELIAINYAVLPEVRRSDSIAGTVSKKAAAETGLATGIPVAVGGADSAVEAFGTGAIGVGDGVVKLGTSCCVNVITEGYSPSRRTLTYPYLFGGKGLSVAATTNGTATLKWFRSGLLGQSMPTFDEIVRAASAAPPGSDGLIFHPYLMGERTPHWDPRLRGAFVGLCSHHGIAELARALLEGVAFSIKDCLVTLREMSLPIARLSLLGGGSKSDLWSQIVADVLQVELKRPAASDASYGAALLAGLSVDGAPDWSTAAEQRRTSEQVVRPVAETAQVYEKYFKVFRESVAAMAPHYHALHDLSAPDGAS